MNRPIHAPTAQQRRIRRIHNPIHILLRNIPVYEFERCILNSHLHHLRVPCLLPTASFAGTAYCLLTAHFCPPSAVEYFLSISPTCSTANTSLGSVPNGVLNHASKISCATVSEVVRKLMHNTFARFHSRAPFAVSASWHNAARIPGTLFAASATPVPV